MSTRIMRGPAVRGYQRRKTVLDLDLNNDPPVETRDQGETSSQAGLQEPIQIQHRHSIPPAAIDVEAIDDDVVESSARAFAEARNKSRRDGGRTIVDVDAEERSRVARDDRNKRRRGLPNQTIINTDLYINLEGSNNSMREEVVKPAPPPKDPVFSCPICMGSFVEEMSTKCGHIFCKACITTAIKVQGKCPTCRRKVTAKELIRVFLPVMR